MKIKSKLGGLQHCNLEDANWMLRKGWATEAEAEAYLEMWNTPGMRNTTLKMDKRLVIENGVEMLSPFLKQV